MELVGRGDTSAHRDAGVVADDRCGSTWICDISLPTTARQADRRLARLSTPIKEGEMTVRAVMGHLTLRWCTAESQGSEEAQGNFCPARGIDGTRNPISSVDPSVTTGLLFGALPVAQRRSLLDEATAENRWRASCDGLEPVKRIDRVHGN